MGSVKKGPLFEAMVVAYLQSHGFPYAERRVLGGQKDRGDVAGIPGVCLELKNCKEMKLGPWLNEAADEADNANAEIFAVVHKRIGKGDPGEAFVTMPLRVFATILRDSEFDYADAPLHLELGTEACTSA